MRALNCRAAGRRGKGSLLILLLAAGLLATHAAPPPPPPGVPPGRPPAVTNRSFVLPGAGLRTNLALPQPPGKAGVKTATNALAGTKGKTAATGTNAPARFNIGDSLKRLQTSGLLYPVIGGVLVVALALLIFFQLKLKKAPRAQPPAGQLRPLAAHKKGPVAVHVCNVLDVDTEARRVWQFDAHGSFRLNREHTSLATDPLPKGMVAKDWRTLFQRKLNIAWLSPEHVFLRVAHLPRSDFDETSSMVELQMEKLSPMPVTQIVWSFYSIPHPQDNLQTVVVMIVARNVVEEYLGKLEGEGFLADRLELPVLDQLQATAITADGAWIYPQGGSNAGLVAWWYGGVLQTLDLLTLPATNRPATLREQLTQMAWAGEMEGWLTSPPAWHLVADVAAADWEPALREGLGQPVDLVTPLPDAQLAALTARRATQSDARATLMPAEFAARYQQQFFDRLWMRGLGAVVGVYVVGVAVYLAAVAVATYRTTAVEDQVAALGEQYTNTLKLEARFQVLKDREDLKFAALDCWGTAAKLLPEGFTIESMRFADGRRLSLSGSAPADQIKELYKFEADMRKAQANGQPLFKAEGGESATFRAQGQNATWAFSLDLKREETQ